MCCCRSVLYDSLSPFTLRLALCLALRFRYCLLPLARGVPPKCIRLVHSRLCTSGKGSRSSVCSSSTCGLPGAHFFDPSLLEVPLQLGHSPVSPHFRSCRSALCPCRGRCPVKRHEWPPQQSLIIVRRPRQCPLPLPLHLQHLPQRQPEPHAGVEGEVVLLVS